MKTIIKYSICFFILISIYICILILSAFIPQRYIRNNVERSVPQLINPIGYYRDYFDDSIIFELCLRQKSYSPFISSLEMNIKSNAPNSIDSILVNYNPINSIIHEFDEEQFSEYKYDYSYARYWHGYVGLIKPLLIFEDYNGICLIFAVISLLLIIVFEYLMIRKIGLKEGIIFFLGLLSINYFNLWVSLSLDITLLLSVLFSIIILIKNKTIEKSGLLFFIFGSLTAFLCWFNFNLITFGLPIIIWYLLYDNTRYKYKYFLELFLAYMLGLGLTWISKWIITDICTNHSIIKDALNQVFFRLESKKMISADGKEWNINRVNAILLNIKYYRTGIFLFLVCFNVIGFKIILNKERIINKSKNDLAFFGTIVAMPIIVYLLTPNHSYIHAEFFTYRILVMTFIGITLLMDRMIIKKSELKNNKEKETDEQQK